MTRQDAPGVVASMSLQLAKLGYTTSIGNSTIRPGELILYIADMALCPNNHIYDRQADGCPHCATSGTPD